MGLWLGDEGFTTSCHPAAAQQLSARQAVHDQATSSGYLPFA